jgi:Zn-finger nucleic acid-binding protein
MNCPRCAKPMQPHRLDGHMDRDVEVDLCVPCQSVWFDEKESLQLTPGATLAMFRLIGENVSRPAPEDREITKCPRCKAQLRRTQDMQRNTRFEYFRCPNDHGRLTMFLDFLKEKDFIKPLTASQIAALRRNLQAINCSNCGAPIDLAKRSDCVHCGSPLSMLDMQQAERLVAQLRDAARTDKPIDPALPLALARARREAEAAFQHLPGQNPWDAEISSMGLVGAGLAQLFRILK